ncbi:hypothetical protein N7486_000252 [Penicillium sp. IBT 16267x]|nr:hypothetical protein N7486_000252 [Penicillium sp. IBT 16267x]
MTMNVTPQQILDIEDAIVSEQNPPRDDGTLDYERCARLHNYLVAYGWMARHGKDMPDLDALAREKWFFGQAEEDIQAVRERLISAGELDVDHGDPNALDKQLKRIFKIAKQFDAVLLLDEADAYMERRIASYGGHNRLVTVFLRNLEYYEGILFLTTNRATDFDDAVLSRIHLKIKYGNLALGLARMAVLGLAVEWEWIWVVDGVDIIIIIMVGQDLVVEVLGVLEVALEDLVEVVDLDIMEVALEDPVAALGVLVVDMAEAPVDVEKNSFVNYALLGYSGVAYTTFTLHTVYLD